jgi:DNA modification methylase
MATSSVKVLNQKQSDSHKWALYQGDCVEVAKGLPDASIDFTVYSPPFESLYTYSNSERDMGNNPDSEAFWTHYKFLISEQMRITKPGRLVSVHCMNLPTSKQFHGYIGLRDFRGEIIRAFQEVGFIYHAEVTIWKDPVVSMQRTKALGLLWKQLKKDSAMSRNGVPDYLVTFRKPGANAEPVAHTPEEFPVDEWQGVASPTWDTEWTEEDLKLLAPVWDDINQSDTLNGRTAREHQDERHVCPLQLQVIERALKLWSNPNDVVFSPFAGIGSEGYQALKMRRRFIGIELKESYWKQACLNLSQAEKTASETELFSECGELLGIGKL